MILFDPDLKAGLANALQTAIAPLKMRRGRAPWAERIPTKTTLKRFLDAAQEAVRLKGEVNVLLTTDQAIRRMNREFRGKNKATDVLSFPTAPMPGLKAKEQPVGDLAISVETARRQAAGQGHALTCELKVLMLHGLLHLAGFDHEADEGEMARKEGRLREQLGLPQGLIERVERKPAKNGAALASHPSRKGRGKDGARSSSLESAAKAASRKTAVKKSPTKKSVITDKPVRKTATKAARRAL